MPKKLSTFAKCDKGVRNPFTRRCVDLGTPTAKSIIQLAHHVNEFKRRLEAADIPKPDRQMVVDQWQYIARITDVRPVGLPTPEPNARPPKLSKKQTDVQTAEKAKPISKKRPPPAPAVFVGPKISSSSSSAKQSAPVFVHFPASHPPRKVPAAKPAPRRTTKKQRKSDDGCEKTLGRCRTRLQTMMRDLHACTVGKEVVEKERKAALAALKSKQKPRAKQEAPAASRAQIGDLRRKLLRRKKKQPAGQTPTSATAKISGILNQMDGGGPPVQHAQPPPKKRRLEPTAGGPETAWAPAFAAAAGVRMPPSVSSHFPVLPPPMMVQMQAPARKKVADFGEMERSANQTKFMNKLASEKDQYYGNLGLKGLLPQVKTRVVAKIDDIILFMRDPSNFELQGATAYPKRAPPGFDKSDSARWQMYEAAAGNVLNSAARIRGDAARARATLTERELADAADVLAKSSVFTMLVNLLDPVLNEEVEEGAEEGDPTYTPVSEIEAEMIVEPITFLIGAGASKDAGIETFVNMSAASGAALNRILEAAWSSSPKPSASDERSHAESVDWEGSIRSYFFPAGAPGEQLRHCLTTMAARYYPVMMLAAWEFMYNGVRGKHPSLTHGIIKGLEALTGDDGGPVLANTITMNVDALEFAAGIDDISIIPAHGTVLLKQPIDTAIGRARASLVNSVDEIRSGKFRPAIVLYGEDVLPSAQDLDNVAKDADGGTLIIIGASLSTGGTLLENMRMTTTIVVNPDSKTADDTLALLDESSDAADGGGGVTVMGDVGGDEEEEVIKGFSTTNSFALRTPQELLELLNSVYQGLKVPKHTKTTSDPEVASKILERINEYVK